MTREELEEQLAVWSNPITAAALIQDMIDNLSADLTNPNVNVGLKVLTCLTISRLNTSPEEYIDKQIAMYQDAIDNVDNIVMDVV